MKSKNRIRGVIISLFVLCNFSLVLSEDTKLHVVENDTTTGDLIRTWIYAASFNITNDTYIFEIKFYMNNSSYFENDPKSTYFEIRDLNTSDSDGLYDPYSNGANDGILLQSNITFQNSSEINGWVTKKITPTFLKNGTYYIYVHLNKPHVEWFFSRAEGNNSTVRAWNSGWVNLSNYLVTGDFTLILNTSTSPITTYATSENTDGHYSNPTTISVNYTDMAHNNILNATAYYNITSLGLNGMMSDPNNDGMYTASVNITQINPLTINFTAYKNGFQLANTSSTITISERPTQVTSLTDTQLIRGDIVTFELEFIDTLTSQKIENANLTCTYANNDYNLTEVDGIYHVNLSILDDEGSRSITFYANKTNYEDIIFIFNYEVFLPDLTSTFEDGKLFLYYENPLTKEKLRILEIHVKIKDMDGALITTEIKTVPNDDGYYIFNFAELVPEGNYSIEVLAYSQGNLIKTEYQNITYLKEDTSSSTGNELYFIIAIVAALAALGLFMKTKKKVKTPPRGETEIIELDHTLDRLPAAAHRVVEGLSEVEKRQITVEIGDDRYSTGTPTIDLLFEKGIPKKSTILCITPVCDEKDIIIEKIIEKNVKTASCIYIGQTIPAYLDSLLTYDQFFSIVTDDNREGPTIFHSDSGPTSIGLNLSKVLRDIETEEKILIFDLLTEFVSSDNMGVLQNFVNSLKNKAKEKNISIVAFVNSNMDHELVELLSESFDGEIKIQDYAHEKIISVDKFSYIEHAEGSFILKKDHDRNLHVHL